MIRGAKIIFCDNEHGTGDETYPDLRRDTGELVQDYVQPRSIRQLRKEAKAFGWTRHQGVDYCPGCSGDDA